MLLADTKVVIFDWDGTLMDSVAQIVHCIMAAATELALPLTPVQAKNIIGLGLPEAMHVLFPQCPELHPTIISTYAKHFVASCQQPQLCATLFANAERLLQHLQSKGLLLAVATGKSRIGLERMFTQTALKDYFATSRCADETKSKPHPLMLEQIMAELGVTPQQCIMVGDSSYDLAMAASICMPSIGLLHGVHDYNTLAACQPVATYSSLTQWLTHLGQHNN